MYYIDNYYLEHITTEDTIHKMVNKGLLTAESADEIWIKMVARNRKLRFNTYSEFLLV